MNKWCYTKSQSRVFKGIDSWFDVVEFVDFRLMFPKVVLLSFSESWVMERVFIGTSGERREQTKALNCWKSNNWIQEIHETN